MLHYLAPAIILLFCIASEKRKPAALELSVLLMVTAGVFILAIQGSPGHLAITKRALFFGIVSAVFLAVYNLYPGKLLERFSPPVIAGWGVL